MKTSFCATMPGVAVLKKTQNKKKASKSNNSSDAVIVKEDDMSTNNSHRPLPVKCVGHVLKDGEMRSQDVNIQEDVHFSDMYFKEEVLAGLHSTGFMKPSPVQLQAIPTGCCGLDLIIQAKSGTGKTCVFTVVALEMVVTSAPTCQVLVVAPTREIAVQIASVISSVGRHMAALRVQTFIGGTEVEKNISCHIAVGTPGRLHHLLSAGILSSKNIRLLVLDEADQLLESFRNVVLQVVAALPLSKQIICTSATYTPSLQDLAKKMMRSPSHISLGSKQLLAVTQYVHQLPYTESLDKAFRAKLLHLKGILGSAVFNQCLIFTNSITRCESVYDSLHRDGWPVARLCGGQTQQQRLKALDDLTNHRCRVMVATDLAARGLDSPHVSLVVSLEPPPHPHTYLHRVGRAGRFGSKGLSVVLACQGDDWLHVQAIATVLDLTLLILPDPSLAHDTEPLQRLPLLSHEQLQKWTLSTSHRLTYSSAVNGGSYDPLEVWKLNPSNGAALDLPMDSKSESNNLRVEPPEDYGTNDGSSLSGNVKAEINQEVSGDVASLLLTEDATKETLFSISANQSLTYEKKHSLNEKKGQRTENQCTKNEHRQKVCVLSEFKKICKDDGDVSTNSDLSSGLNSLNKNEKSFHSVIEPENFLDESTELKELAEIVHLEQPEPASSFSFSSIRDEVEALASCILDEKTHRGKVVVGCAAEDPSKTTTTRLGVLLARQHQRHAARLEEMKEEWKNVTVSPREALKSLQRGSTTGELLAQLRQSQCVTYKSDAHQTQLDREGTAEQTKLDRKGAADQTKLDGKGAAAQSSDEHTTRSQSVSHHTHAFQFHLGALMTEKQQEKLDRKKRAGVVKSRDEACDDVTGPVYLEVQSKEPEKLHRHHNGARKKEQHAKVEVMHKKRVNGASHVRSNRHDHNLRRSDGARQNFTPLVLFDRSSNFNQCSKKGSNRSSVEDAVSFQSHSSQRAKKEKKAHHVRRPTSGYKYKCEYKGCSKDAVVSDEEGASSQDVTSDEYYNYRDTRPRHGRRQKTHDGCRLCAQEQHVDLMKDDLRAHLHYYHKFALMNYYVTVMGRTAATAAQHCMPQYYDPKAQVQCPDCVTNRRHRHGRNARESSSDAGTRDTTSRRGAKQRDEARKE